MTGSVVDAPRSPRLFSFTMSTDGGETWSMHAVNLTAADVADHLDRVHSEQAAQGVTVLAEHYTSGTVDAWQDAVPTARTVRWSWQVWRD